MAARVRALRETGIPMAFVVAGDLLYSDGHDNHGLQNDRQESLRADLIAQILHELEVDAIAVGPHDLDRGLDSLRALAQEHELPLLFTTRDASPSMFASSIMKPLGDLQLRITADADLQRDGLETRTPELPTADLTLALSVGTRRFARSLRADFVLQAGLDREEAIAPQETDDGWLFHAGRQGQGLLVVDVWRTSPGTFANVSAWSQANERATLEADIAELEAQLREWEAEGRDEADLASQRARLARFQRDLTSLETPRAISGNAFSAERIDLDPDAPRDPSARTRIEAYDVQVNEHNREAFADRAPPPPREGEPHYVGNARCSSCHESAARWWNGHPHGHAYSTLTERNKQFHLECVGCHVTGYERPGGSTVTHHLGTALQNVGCETCHGPGSAHAEAPESGAIQRETTERTCTGCHNEEHSDRFNYEAYMRLVVVPGHGLPEETP